MVGLLDMPVEVLEEISKHCISDSKRWSTSDGTCTSELALRRVHPHLTPAVTRVLFSQSKLVLNPRDCGSVTHLINFLREQGNARHLTSIEVKAPNFLQKTHRLNAQIPCILVGLCHKLANLELSLDGHFVQLSEFPQMKHLRTLSVSGESVYTGLGNLSYLAPALEQLELHAPCTSGPLAQHDVETDAQVYPPAATANFESRNTGQVCGSLPNTLSSVHIANLNTPTNQTLLHNLPFRPVHFSYSLIHNYDLLDLAMLLCERKFIERTRTMTLSGTSFVAKARLLDFKNTLEIGLCGAEVQLEWKGR